MKLLKHRLILILAILLVATNSYSQKTGSLNASNVDSTILNTFACEGTNCAGITIDATAGGIALTSANYNPTVTGQPAGFSRAQMADCYNTGAKIWITVNSAITLASGKGRAILDGGTFRIYGYTNISNFKAIRDAGNSSTLYCDYYRQP